MNEHLLRELTQANGIASCEDQVRDIVCREMRPLVDDLRIDTMGNVVGHINGSGGPRVALAAHMDEIGFLVRHIDDNGFLRLQPVGGFDPRTLVCQRVTVQTQNGEALVGVLQPGTKPIHLLRGETPKELKLDDLFVDLGMAADRVRELVQPGDMVTTRREFENLGDTVITKALDDRAGVYVMLEAVRRAGRVNAEVYPIATVQEEVGCRGAMTSAFAVHPEIAIALDTTIAADIPGVPGELAVTRLGEGVAIKVYDSSQLPNRKLIAHLRSLAEEHSIPFQMELLPAGGTDASSFQRAQDGVFTCTISIPSRYVHTVNEMVSVKDLDAAVDLLAAFLVAAGSADYGYDVPE